MTELLTHRDMYVYVLPLGRQWVVNKSSSKLFDDVLAIVDALAVVKTAPVHRKTSPVGVKGALQAVTHLLENSNSYD